MIKVYTPLSCSFGNVFPSFGHHMTKFDEFISNSRYLALRALFLRTQFALSWQSEFFSFVSFLLEALLPPFSRVWVRSHFPNSFRVSPRFFLYMVDKRHQNEKKSAKMRCNQISTKFFTLTLAYQGGKNLHTYSMIIIMFLYYTIMRAKCCMETKQVKSTLDLVDHFLQSPNPSI